MKWRDIAERVEVDYRTCQKIYQRYRDSIKQASKDDQKDAPPTPSNRKRKGRPKLFSDQEKERLEQFVTRGRETRRIAYENVIQA